MSAANPLIAPNTATATVTLNANEADAVFLMTNGTGLATIETVTINIVNTANVTPYVSPYTNSVVGLTATLQSAVLPGGCIYQFVKSVTAGACGLDQSMKPRIGGGAS